MNDYNRIPGCNVDTTVNGRYLLTYTLDKDGHVIVLTRVVNVIGGVSDGE